MGIQAYSGSGWVLTKLEELINWGRKRSPWPLPYGTACCGIEMMCALASGYDMARFGAERPSFSPRQADVRPASRAKAHWVVHMAGWWWKISAITPREAHLRGGRGSSR